MQQSFQFSVGIFFLHFFELLSNIEIIQSHLMRKYWSNLLLSHNGFFRSFNYNEYFSSYFVNIFQCFLGFYGIFYRFKFICFKFYRIISNRLIWNVEISYKIGQKNKAIWHQQMFTLKTQ